MLRKCLLELFSQKLGLKLELKRCQIDTYDLFWQGFGSSSRSPLYRTPSSNSFMLEILDIFIFNLIQKQHSRFMMICMWMCKILLLKILAHTQMKNILYIYRKHNDHSRNYTDSTNSEAKLYPKGGTHTQGTGSSIETSRQHVLFKVSNHI